MARKWWVPERFIVFSGVALRLDGALTSRSMPVATASSMARVA
jgi:hypothetical protein